jgi:lysophospholipase L1-like esterase
VAVVATPAAAVVQGCLMLSEYRRRHGRAPFPVSPSRGLVVVASASTARRTEAEEGSAVETSASAAAAAAERNQRQQPLRLLVIGDSLAAGVGTSGSGTPILPQSIARGLSRAAAGSGGGGGLRAVHWTCIGTPGAGASRIVRDLSSYREPPPNLLELRRVQLELARRRARDWWWERRRRRRGDERGRGEKEEGGGEDTEEEEEEEDAPPVQRWWSRVRRDVEDLQKDVNELKEVFRVPREESEEAARERQRLKRRKSFLDPDLVEQYDIAVVLTGFNDLKDVFLPFMMCGGGGEGQKNDGKRGGEEEQQQSTDSLKDALVRIIHALQSKMKLDLKREGKQNGDLTAEDDSMAASTPTDHHRRRQHRGPLVVFPAMPASPLPLTHYPPLSWFLVPLIRMMDHNKKLLAANYPGLVLYVDAPTPDEFRDIEAGKGELHEGRRAERVLLQLTDVSQRAQEKVKELMDKHYHSKPEARRDGKDEHDDDDRPVYSQCCREHVSVNAKQTPGSTLLAADGIHPNDAGYDFWGRHIAAAIVREWDKRDDEQR